MDVFSKTKRSSIMSKIKGKNTQPEVLVRSILHRMGYRFRLHRKDLPGKPDIVLPKHNKVIFVHGCFWHGHENCPRSKRPTTNREFWETKISKNIERDIHNRARLKELGWDVLTVWQCWTKDKDKLNEVLIRFCETERMIPGE